MLHDQGLPLHLLDEACNRMIYVHNHSPHRIFVSKTLEEAYSGIRPNVGQFNIFGSSFYYHVTKDVWKNLGPKT